MSVVFNMDYLVVFHLGVWAWSVCVCVCVCVCAQSYLILCDPCMDCSLPGSPVHGIFQARILEWGALHSPGDRPDSGIEPTSLASLALTGRFFTYCAMSQAWISDKSLDLFISWVDIISLVRSVSPV